jgi:glycosyltransferase involved in cell wall biosynthesis
MFDMTSEMDRKNPLGLIRAFRRAFAATDAATLLLKVVRPEADAAGFAALQEAAAGANVVVLTELTGRARTLGFIQMCDCYISLHRSEGFGLTMAEAMALAKPVIATRYSGNLDFMNDANSFLVDAPLVPVETKGVNYRCGGRWAEPSEERAAELMRLVRDEPALAATRGAKARADVLTELSPATVGKRMRARLEEIRRITPHSTSHRSTSEQIYA